MGDWFNSWGWGWGYTGGSAWSVVAGIVRLGGKALVAPFTCDPGDRPILSALWLLMVAAFTEPSLYLAGRIPHSGRRSRDRAGGCVRIIRKSGYVGKTVAGSTRSIRETGRREKSFRERRARCRSERPIGSRQFCCIAAATATSWHRKTDCLDKSFCGHRRSLC